MRKILFYLLLLISSISIGQTSIANKLKITAAIKDNLATRVMVQDSLTGELKWVLKNSLGTVKSVTGLNGVTVATGTTTPVIGLGAITPTSTNGVSAATMAFNDATSSIQTQLNGKQAAGTYATGTGTASGTNTGDNAVNSLYSGLVTNATHTGDATGATALTVKGINGTLLSGLATGILKNTTTTGVPSIAVAADFPTLNQNTTGTASNITGVYGGAITSGQVTTALTYTPENAANKQNSLTVDGSGVKYSTVDAVNAGLNLKVDKTNLFNTEIASNPPTSFATSSYDAFPLMIKTLSNKIKLFYRVGTAHVDNTGVIVMKTSTDGGATYTSASTIISESGVDCRNISGGITPTGRIILYFLKYNATSLLSISQGYIYSDDEGATWSTYTTIETNSHTFYSPYGGLVNIGDGKIMQPWYGETGTSTYSTYVKISSDNGATWNASVLVATSPTTKYGEASYAYLDGGTIIGIVRNSLGAVLQQVKSTDNGGTWAVVGATTFDTGAHVSPTLYTFSDTNNEKYLACFYANRTDNKLKVVIGSYTGLITDVNGWDINTRTDLTTHTSTDFGYPTVVKSLNNNKFLIALYKASSASVANINFLNFTPLYNSITSVAGIKTSSLFRNNRGIGTHLLIDNTSNLNRWAWQMINAESTGNAGSDLNLLYFNDAGSTLGSYMTFTRSSGLSSFVGQIRSNSTTAVGFYQARKSDTSGSGVFGGNSFALRNGSTSEDLNFDIYNRTSSTWTTPFAVKNNGTINASSLASGTTTQMVTADLNGNLGYQAIPLGGTTNLAYTASGTNGIVASDTGTDAAIPLADGTNAGLLSPSGFTDLSNAVLTNNNQTITGLKTFDRSATNPSSGINLSVGTGSGSVLAASTTGSNTAVSFSTSSSGIATNVSSSSTGTALNVRTTSSGLGLVVNSDTGSTGNPFTIQNAGVETYTLSKTGDINATKLYSVQVTPTAKTATATLTIAEILTNITTVTSTTAVTLTLPTGTLTDAGVQSGTLAVNDSFEWVVINLGSSSGAVTMAAGTGHTYVGAASVAIGTSATFRTRKTAANTFVTYRI